MPARSVRLVLSIALVLLAQGAARAAPVQWQGTLSIELLAGNPSFQAEGGGVASVNASSGGLPAHLETLRLAASRQRLSLAETGLVTDPDVRAWYGRRLVVTASVQSGGFSAISAGVASTAPIGGRELPLRGVFRLGSLLPTPIVPGTTAPMTAPLTWLTVNGATAGMGVGGGYLSRLTYPTWTVSVWTFHLSTSETTICWTYVPIDEVRRISIQGAPWTIKTATAHGVTPPIFRWSTDQLGPLIVSATRRGFAHGPFSATTSTAQPGGMLQMITPMQVRVDHRKLRYGSDLRYGWAAGGFGVLALRFIPEPGVGLLLATGVAGLVAIGRRRMRR